MKFAERIRGMNPSAVREILKVAERPDVLSFAGGLPAPELFPAAAIAAAFAQVLSTDAGLSLQYSTTEGHVPLREWILARLRSQGIEGTLDQLVITNGSQQGIDLVAKILLDPGSEVLVEDPTYLAALQTFSAYQAVPVAVPSDDEGMSADALAEILAKRKPKLLYLVPAFGNPTGRTVSLARRRALLRLCAEHRVPVLEDDPYGELRFSGSQISAMAALGEGAEIIHLGTFSKTLAPGLRIGWALGPTEAIRKLTIAKQAADLHTATLAQRATAQLLGSFDYEGHLASIRKTYGSRCTAMVSALHRHLPDLRFRKPEGGLFIWAQLPEGLDGELLLAEAVKAKVAFVPGRPFFVDGQDRRHVRLNYSNRSEALIEEGMKRLGAVLKRAAA